MNPASWMLDVLLGMDSSGTGYGDTRSKRKLAGPAVVAGSTTVPVASASPAAGNGSTTALVAKGTGNGSDQSVTVAPSGPPAVDYQSILRASPAWAAAAAVMKLHATPAPGSQPVKVSSIYARSVPYQFWVVLHRMGRTYWRDTVRPHLSIGFTEPALLEWCILCSHSTTPAFRC
jgi:hypothetical protein